MEDFIYAIRNKKTGDTAIKIMQEIAAVDQESKTNIIQFADILKAKEKK